jgi:hypothetical protein
MISLYLRCEQRLERAALTPVGPITVIGKTSRTIKSRTALNARHYHKCARTLGRSHRLVSPPELPL